MFSTKDKKQIENRGSELHTVLVQIENFKNGFPYLQITDAATVGNGIIRLNETDLTKAVNLFEEKVAHGIRPLKFIPASGAASRMFKDLYEAFDAMEKTGSEDFKNLNKGAKQYIDGFEKFAFAPELKTVIGENGGELNDKNKIDFLLNEKGLNYGSLPKGLLKFHKYENGERTPFEEHLVEGAAYAKDKNNKVRLHFTVSPEHQKGFEELLNKLNSIYEKQLDVTFEIEFSQQKPSTDTIAVDLKNEPFRENDGSLLFRPAGHGALIENLNDINADIIFIKNIDNVVPDRLKKPTIDYKKALAGLLLKTQEKLFFYQKELNEKHPVALDSAFLAAASGFLENTLNTKPESDRKSVV